MKKIKYSLMTLSILCSFIVFGQQASYGNVYIFKPGTAVFYGNHSFQSGGNTPGNGIIGTDRDSTRSTYTFHTNTAIPADMANAKHVNGYVKATASAAGSGFIFPIGSGSFYAPASVAKYAGLSDLEAAYFKANPATAIVPDMKGGNYAALPSGAPFTLSSKGINIDSVSNQEYWDLNGTDPIILTLSFDAARSNVNALTGGDISKLIIVGWDGTKWVSLGGVASTGSITTSGTITTANSFVPNNFIAYTFASSCTKPTLTVGNISCTGSSYQINFTSNATKGILSSLGTVSGNTITGISKNSTVTITASNGGTCTSVSTVTTPNVDCPTPCVLPQLTAGNGLCNGGTTWEFAFIETTGATVSTSAGTISGKKVTNIPVGTSVTLSASNGTCTSTVNVSSPTNCNDTCNNPLISVAGTNCKADGTAFYTVFFLKASSRVSVTANAGTVSGDSVINIPSGTKVTLTATTSGCSNSTIIDVESKSCPTCVKPSLTAGNIACDGTSYSINFLTNATNGVVSSVGTVGSNKITGVAKNTSVTITASNGSGCTTSAIVTTPNTDCPNTCILPQLTAGTGTCNGTTWQFSFLETTGATITASAGIVSGNKVSGIAVGTNVEITATSTTGNCVSKVTINSPSTCNDPCSNTLLSVGGTSCKSDGSAFYTVNFLRLNSSVNVTASAGTVSGDSVINIPSGTNVVISATLAGCKDTTKVTVSSKTCPTCTKPSITAGNVNCSGSNYTLNFLTNATNGVTSSEGTVSGNAVTGILKNKTVTLTASNGIGCTNSISVSTPNVDCPSSCVTPQLTAGSGICNGTIWDVSFVESTGANIVVSAGTKGNNKVTGISVGTNLTITAINGSCATTITINSPTGCANPCSNPLASIGGSLCKSDGSAFYTAYFTKLDNTVSVTASAGTVSGDSVVNIPSGTDVTITASRPGCSVNTVVKVPARQCPSCSKPSLTVGNLSCNGTSYTVDYMTDAINGVTSSLGTIGNTSVSGISKNATVTITASNGAGCTTSASITTPNADCPTTCTLPKLTVGNGVCNGTTWQASFTETTGAIISTNAGTISGNKVINIPVGTNLSIIASNGTCTSTITTTSPSSCSTSTDSCNVPLVSIGGSNCKSDGSAFYTVYYTKLNNRVSITSTAGTVNNDSITDIPSGTNATITATLSGCANQTKVTVSSKQCPSCVKPTLTAGNINCNGTNYMINFQSNATNGVSSSLGTVSGNTITGVSKSSNVVITASNGPGCTTSTTVSTPNLNCPTACVLPQLMVGNAVCNGTSWEFSFNETTGATIQTTSGTISGNKVTGISVGTNVSIIAVNGTCISTVTVASPSSCGGDPCANPLVSIGGTNCKSNGSSFYSVYFTKAGSSVVVKSSAGTVSGDSVIDVPSGTNVVISATLSGCKDTTKVTVSGRQCPTCIRPTLTAGNISCVGSSYTIDFSSNATNGVSASTGVIGTNKITGVAKNASVTLIATNGSGCNTSTTVTTPNLDCPTACTLPQLTAGNGICNGSNWEFSFSELTGASISTNFGTISGNKVINIPINSDVTITATNGSCVSNITVVRPVSCIDPCANPLISIGGSNCKNDGSAFYTVYISKLNSSVSITTSAGTVSGDSIVNIPSGSSVSITGTLAGCGTSTNISLPARQCPSCLKPSLTAGNISCNGSSYAISFASNASGGVTTNLGSVGTNSITGIAKNSNVVITASNGSGCTTTATVTTPNTDCPTSCVLPQLTVGTGVCNGSNYEVSFIENTGATVSTSVGTISGNKVINIPVGTNVVVTATSSGGACTTSVTASSPARCGTDTCSNPLISFGGTKCKTDGSAFYTVYFSRLNSRVVVTASAGTVTGDSVVSVPSGTNITLSATLNGCGTSTSINVSAKQCPTCVKPTLTAGNISCDGTNYMINFSSNASVGVTASTGTVSGNTISNISKNSNVVITASNGSGCTTSTTVSTPNVDCPSACVLPQLTAGNGICNGTTWDLSFTESTGASVSTSTGTISRNKVTGIAVGTNVTLTASNGTCISTITINSPTSCSDPCANPLLSVSGTKCKTDGSSSYTIYFTKASSSVSVSTTAGTVSGDSIVNVPSSSSPTITATLSGCGTSTSILVPAKQCPTCIKPALSAGDISCNGTSYTMNFFTNATNGVTSSNGTVSGNSITNVDKNSSVTIIASNGAGCTSTTTVKTPNLDCPTACVLPKLTAGNSICTGSTWEFSFTENTNATITTTAGTISGNKVTNIGNNTDVTITATNGSCISSIVVVRPASCNDPCSNSLVSIGGSKCRKDGGAFYTVYYSKLNSNVTVTSNLGTVVSDSITDIPSGSSVTVTAKLTGCSNSTIVTVPAKQCPTCVKPTLTIGKMACSGTTYNIEFVSNASNGVTTNLGTVSGNMITGISKNASVTVTASNGSGCTTAMTATTPNLDCPTACVLPNLTLGNGLCNGSTWEVSFTESTGATISPSAGTRSGNKIVNIPIGTNLTITASNGSCISTIGANSPTNCSDPCSNPLVSISGTKCNPDGTATYTAYFTKLNNNVIVTTTAGTISGDSIVNIPSTSNVKISATLAGCGSATEVTLPAQNCPSCIKPTLTAGNISCNGTSYVINFLSNATSGVTSSAGTISGNTVTNVPKNTTVTITASNGSGCTTKTTVSTPNADCPTTCVLPQLTAGNGVCNGSNWEISFSETTGATVFASSGTISGNKVIDIPVGTNVTISAINGTCNTNVNVTSPISCSSTSCDKPLISLGGTKCNPNGTKMYTAYFTKTSSSVVVTSTLGTVSGDSIINIPSDSSVVITASLTGCSNSTKVTMPSQVCLACVSPILTVGSASCAGTSYEISFTSNATSGVTTSAGTISGNKIINVPKNTNVTITASNAASCATVSTVATPNADCPSTATCVTPKLVVGNGICNGTDWEFSFVETTGATVLVSSGTISGNKVTGISVGTNVTITAVNGTCASNITINSPSTCSGNACEKPLISFGGTRCNTSGTKTYTAFFTRSSSSVVVSSTAGTVTAGDSIINIPNDSLPTITASLSGCTTIAKVKLTPNECNTCIVPILTVSNATCSGSSYEITFTTNASNGVQASAGTVSGNKVINIPKNSTVTITASNVTGCSTVSKVTTPNFDCPNTSSCVTPKISIGNGVCNGTEWELSFVETTGATIFASSGTVVGNKITGLTVGSSVTITAVNGTCVANITINSPASCTGNACDKPLISLGGTRCNTSGVKTYTAFFTRSSSSVVVTSTAGTVTAGDSIINIPNDSLPTITATLSGCATATKVKLSANECNACVAPVLTVSNASCNGSSYEFTFNTNSTSVTSSAGTVSGSKVINAPKNTSITISATNGSCITTAKVLTPNSDCPSSASCVTPVLTVGNGICNGTNWEFSFVETTGATIVPSSGTISGNKVTGIPVGTDVTLTAVNGSCVSSVVAVSPSSCSGNTCDKPLISLGGTKCSPDGTKTYIAYLIKSSSNVVITSTLGTVSGDSIINIPSDSTPIVTATLTGCSIATVIKLPSKVCATCVAPVLTLGSASCGGSSYEVTFSTNAVGGVTTSAGTVSGDKIIGIPKNTIVTVTASNGTGCATIIKVTTPNEDCPNAPSTCVTPKLTAGNGVCNGTTWDFSFTETTGAVISVSAGTISGNKVTGIPVGTNVNIIASNNPTCVVSLNINSPNCSSPDPCDKQLVSIGGTKCNSNGNTYTIYFTKASSSVVVTSKFGTVSGDSIINVPIGKVDTITATITGCSKKIAIPVKASACVGFVVNIDNSKVSKGGTSNINVASNDNLTASANYKFKVSSNPKKGTVVIDSVTGIATYKSTDTSFVGLDSFSYSVTDPVTGEVKTTLVYITIGNPNNVNVVTPEGNGTGVDGEDIFDGNNSIRTKNYNLEALPSNGTVSDFDPATGAFKYTPTPGKCGNDSARVRVIYTYNENGKTPDTFYYMVRMNIPCSSNDIPNYITPNGDGINDAFVIPNFATKYRNAKLIIYNRWGNIVWRSYGSYENNWTGTHYDGLPLPDGVYYYMIENKDDKVLVQPVTGFIQIGRD